MDQHDDFDNVSWKHDADSDVSRPTTSGTDVEESHRYESYDHDANGKRRMSSAHEEPQAGPLADAVDLAGIGDGVLECRVDSPLKENDGTKDAYISYLVTTNVRTRSFDLRERGFCCCLHSPPHSPHLADYPGILANTATSRPTLNLSKSPSFMFGGDLPISISCTKPSIVNIQHARSHLCRTSTRWNMCEATGSARSSQHGGHGHCIGF